MATSATRRRWRSGSLTAPFRRRVDSGAASAAERWTGGNLVILRWLRVQEVPNEIVPPPPHHVERRRAVAVMDVRDDQLIEILVGLDERFGDEHRVVGRNIVVHRAMGEK